MAEKVLHKLLNNQIQLDLLYKWLKDVTPQQADIYKEFPCTQGEFLTHILNFIHEEAPSFDKFSETPRKVHTPKSIRKLEVAKSESKIKRRSALFPELKKSELNASFEELQTRLSPKREPLNKSHLIELNTSYQSPISPIYARYSTKTKSVNKSICLGDFIVPSKKGGSSKKKGWENIEPEVENKKSRRINPTNLSKKFSHAFSANGNSFNFENAEVAESDRCLLAVERLKIASRDVQVANVAVKVPGLCPRKQVKPDLALATHKRQLNRLVEVYSYLLGHNYVLNVTSEIYFILTLALSKHCQGEAGDSDELEIVPANKLFETIHNTVYFAINILERHTSLLKLLDKTCLKLLCVNERLENLVKNVTTENDGCSVVNEVVDDRRVHVCFMSDTDNRDNFPSDASFHAFRKQRDLFYEILRIWEQHHSVEEWSFGIALAGKIKTLLNLYPDAANYRHFCRLFKLQLLSTCGKTKHEESLFENQLTFLSSIPNVNSEKLNRLNSRLVTKAPSSGINAVPTFTGYQEFYKDFIMTASMHTFNVHLRDALIQEILELNNTKFSKNELEEQDSVVDVETKKSYGQCIKSLRLLAKFLGFLESLPYRQTSTNVPEKILSAEVRTRYNEQPPLDLKQLLANSITNSTLVLTIPWITKYLSLLDYTTLRLAYYESLYQHLFQLFHNLSSETRPFHSYILLQLCLGWLFELPHFPSELYFVWCTMHCGSKQRHEVNALDSLDIVDKDVIYVCCPFLNEFKRLLQNNSSQNGTVAFKHITPVTASESPAQINEKRLKLQLEEAFLNGHPVSMRKTVEFVSERVASACVKQICNKLVPEAKMETFKAFKSFVQKHCHKVKFTKKFEIELRQNCNDFLHDKLDKLKKVCGDEVEKHVSKKIPPCIDLLLSDEELKQTKDTCSLIATRMCKERVQQWISTHINDGIYGKEYETEIGRAIDGFISKETKPKLAFILPTMGRNVPHDAETKNAVKVVEIIRTACIDILENSQEITRSTILELLENSEATLRQRCDVNDCISSLITKILVDLLLLLIAHRADLCDSSIMNLFIEFWKRNCLDVQELFKNIISPRNVTLINQSPSQTTTWIKFTDFICLLFKHGVLDCEDFESQCIGIYQQNWNSVVLKQLSSCFQGVVDNYARCNQNNAKFTFLLSYLSDFCSDMDLDLEF